MAIKRERGEVEMAKRRIPLTRILNGREFNDMLEEMKKFRAQFAEEEFLYKAKVYIQYSHGGATAIVRRPETDKEYNDRLEILRQNEFERLERKRIREEKAAIRAEAKRLEAESYAEQTRLLEIENLKVTARKLGLSAADFASLGN